MQRLALRLGTLTAVGLLAACSGGSNFQQLPTAVMAGFPAVGVMREARSAQPSGAFATAAYNDLMKHAEYEYVQMDYIDAMFHARKAMAAARGEAIEPQNPAERMLPADKVAEIQDAYARLNARLAEGFRDADPEKAGVAIGSFDCWIEQQEENFQEADIAACRDAFEAAMYVEPAPEMISLDADVFFDFDKSDLKDEARSTLQKNAEWLKRWTSTRITVEGHCDERGTNEYNIGLGERRARAVRDYLVSLGVGAERILTVSKGEEEPFCRESTEECWAQNRRGHFIITAK